MQKVKFSSCYSFQKCINDLSLSLSRYLKVCLGEVDSGKKFSDNEVEELEKEVTKANAKDYLARTGCNDGNN